MVLKSNCDRHCRGRNAAWGSFKAPISHSRWHHEGITTYNSAEETVEPGNQANSHMAGLQLPLQEGCQLKVYSSDQTGQEATCICRHLSE